MHRPTRLTVAASAADLKSLKLAFLPGTGRMGGALARLHAKNGFGSVTIASRDAARAKEAAALMQSQLPSGTHPVHCSLQIT